MVEQFWKKMSDCGCCFAGIGDLKMLYDWREFSASDFFCYFSDPSSGSAQVRANSMKNRP